MTINEGIAVDAILVKSASRPISNDPIKGLKDRRNIPKRKLDKNGKSLKFSRDLESDLMVEDDKPHYGLKESAGGGLILTAPSSLPSHSYMISTIFHIVLFIADAPKRTSI